jgi:hypothetical protein
MLFSKKTEDEVILILDVQSSVVRGSLVVLKPQAVPHVLFSYNAAIPFKAHTDSSFLIKMTLRAVGETVDAAVRHIHIRAAAEKIRMKVSDVHYVLSSPWIVSQAKMLSMTYLKDTKISKEFILGLIEKERAKLVPSQTEPVRVIEEKIFDVALNGYSVTDWHGKLTKKLDVAFTISVAGTRMIEHFIKECGKAVKPAHVFFHSSLLLQHMGTEKIFPARDSYSIIHVHGELTDVAVIRQHSCAYFGSFPVGVRTLVRKLSIATSSDEHAADSLLTLYTGGHIDETHGKKSRNAIENIAAGWISELKKMFTDAHLIPPPPISVILAAWAHDDFFAQILETTYPKVPITLLAVDDIIPLLSYDPHAERRRLPALYAIAINGMKQPQ